MPATDAPRADAFLFDMRLPDGSGIDLLRSMQQNGSPAPAIMISGHGTIADAVEATRAGAFDFLEKPLSREKVLVALKNALEHASLRRENERLRELVGPGPKMIGASPAFLRAAGAGFDGRAVGCPRAADRRIRYRQGAAGGAYPPVEPVRFHGPFVKVNCAAIPTELDREQNCSATRRSSFTGAAGMPARRVRAGGTAARCSWTRSATCTRHRRRNCCACCRKASSIAWAASSRSAFRCV